MVKKADTYARVLRPGESMMLGRKFSEFEIVLFRPKQHIRAEESKAPDQHGEAGAAAPDRDSSSKEPAANPSNAAPAVSGNKVKFALGPGPSEASHTDRRKNGAFAGSTSAANGLTRDTTLSLFSDEGNMSSMAKRGSNSGCDVEYADLAADAPLFFDTAVCIFYDELTKMDYVATGRTTADSKGIHYLPHVVVLGDEVGAGAYCNYNITRPDGESLVNKDNDELDGEEDDVLVSRSAANNGPTTMAAADGVSVNLRRLGTCAGFLVCATLFGKDACLHREHNVFYMIRKPRNPSPVCLVPLCVSGDTARSCISLMVRKIKAHGNSTWEVVNVSEGLALQDVKSLVLKLQSRGLRDPAHFARDFEFKSSTSHAGDGTYGDEEEDLVSSSSDGGSSELDASHSQKHLGERQEPERSLTSEGALCSRDHRDPAVPTRSGRTFSGLLLDVPRVTREGRRQYNVGRSHVQRNLFDGDTSEEDEVLDDAMRAVVPCYTNTSLIRYDNGAYNVGSKAENLITHYVEHREMYGLGAAGHRLAGGGGGAAGRDGVAKETLPPLLGGSRVRSSADWGTPIPVLDRCQVEEEDGVAARPELPPDLLVTSQDKRLAAATQPHRGSVNLAMKKCQSTIGRVRRSSSAARKGTSRPPSGTSNGQRRFPQRKKADRRGTRAKFLAADAATRTEESRGADGISSVSPASRNSRASPSARQEGMQTKAPSSGTKQKSTTKKKSEAVRYSQ
jgi:hypothetical protein